VSAVLNCMSYATMILCAWVNSADLCTALNIVTILLYTGLTDESEPEAEEDEGSEVDDETQAEYVSDDEHLTECFECQKQQVFCSAAGCLELYCKGCADPDTDNHVQDFLLCAAPSCCGKKQYCQEHQDALHQCHCCKKYVCYKQLCSHCEEPACGGCLEDGVCQDCQ